MGQLAINARRFDPYEGFRFRLKWGGRHVAGFASCSSLGDAAPSPFEGVGGGAHPGVVKLRLGTGSTLTLEHGTTHDFEFFRWASQAWGAASGGEGDELLRELSLELYSEGEERVATYALHRAWPSGFEASPQLDATATATAMSIERLALTHEGYALVAELEPPR